MRLEVYNYIEKLKLKGKTLEIGSYDVNGNIKGAIDQEGYVGLDMRAGKNVDVIANSHKLPFKNNRFDNVLNLDTLEHDDKFWLTIPEMVRVCKVGGLIIIAVPGIGFKKHSHPFDYWRFTGEAVKSLLEGLNGIEVLDKGGLVIGKATKPNKIFINQLLKLWR